MQTPIYFAALRTPAPSERELAEIEAHYERSPIVGEACVFPVVATGAAGVELHAVVVPDLAVLRARRIVNIRELIRFELETLSASLPLHWRVHGFDVTMEPLPRTGAGALERCEIGERYKAGRVRLHAESTAPADDHIARVVSIVQSFVRPSIEVHPGSNLELDLKLDSLDRVELVALLERRFGKRLSDDGVQTAFVVRDLAEALRAAGAPETTAVAGDPWASLLEVEEPSPELRGLLQQRTATILAFFAFDRLVVRSLLRPRVRGLEHLPSSGPFIIAPNHQSYLDPLLVECVLPYRVFRRLFFVGAVEYFQTRLTARLARAFNIVPVDPDAYLLRAMQAGAFGLTHGKVLMLFPEGERSIDGRVKAFRKGAAILSRHLGLPIVPVAIDGMFELWPRAHPLDWRRLLPWSGHRVTISFGAPLAPPQPGASCADHTEAVRTAVQRLWAEERLNVVRSP